MNIQWIKDAYYYMQIANEKTGADREYYLRRCSEALKDGLELMLELDEDGDAYIEQGYDDYAKERLSQVCTLIQLGYAEIDPSDPRKIIKRNKKVVESEEFAFPWEKQPQPQTPR